MLARRALLVVLLVVFHVGLATTASLQSIDFAWAPSYFDDDDGDFLPALLFEHLPTLVVPAAEWIPALALLAAVVASAPRRAFPLEPACVRFRAPPGI